MASPANKRKMEGILNEMNIISLRTIIGDENWQRQWRKGKCNDISRKVGTNLQNNDSAGIAFLLVTTNLNRSIFCIAVTRSLPGSQSSWKNLQKQSKQKQGLKNNQWSTAWYNINITDLKIAEWCEWSFFVHNYVCEQDCNAFYGWS